MARRSDGHVTRRTRNEVLWRYLGEATRAVLEQPSPGQGSSPGCDDQGIAFPHHQNEAMSSSSVVHITSVPTAINSDCGVVGSCSLSDITVHSQTFTVSRLV